MWRFSTLPYKSELRSGSNGSVLHEWTIPHSDLAILPAPAYLPLSIHRIAPLFARAKGTHQVTLEIPQSDPLATSTDSNHLILHTPYTFEYKPSDPLTCTERVLELSFECFFALDYQEIELKLAGSAPVTSETKFAQTVVIRDLGSVLSKLTLPASAQSLLVNFEIGPVPAPETETRVSDFVLSVYNRLFGESTNAQIQETNVA